MRPRISKHEASLIYQILLDYYQKLEKKYEWYRDEKLQLLAMKGHIHDLKAIGAFRDRAVPLNHRCIYKETRLYKKGI